MTADTRASGSAGYTTLQWFPAPADGDQLLDLAEVTRLGRDQFRCALVRRLRVALVGGLGSPLVTEHPEAAADVVMGLVNTLLAGED